MPDGSYEKTTVKSNGISEIIRETKYKEAGGDLIMIEIS